MPNDAATAARRRLAARASELRAAVARNQRAERQTRDSLPIWFRLGGQRVKLANADGAPTPLGQLYHELTGGGLDPWDRTRGTQERPHHTVAFHRDWGWTAVRRKAPGRDGRVDLKVTEKGRSYYRNTVHEYVVQIPVALHYWRPRTRRYQSYHEEDYVALDDGLLQGALRDAGRLTAVGDLSEHERQELIRSRVLAWLRTRPRFDPGRAEPDPFADSDEEPARDDGEEGEHELGRSSDKVYTWDEGRDLKLSELTTRYDHGATHAEVFLDRPLRGAPLCPEVLYERYGLCALALEPQPPDGPGCVVVQLAACLRDRRSTGRGDPLFKLAFIEAELDELWGALGYAAGEAPYELAAPGEPQPWRRHGVTSRMVVAFCRRHHASCWILHGERCVYKFDPPEWGDGHRPLVAFAVHGDHAFFYDSPRAIRGIAQMQPVGLAPAPAERRLVRVLHDPLADDEELRPAARRLRRAEPFPFEPQEALRQALGRPGPQVFTTHELGAAAEALWDAGVAYRELLGSHPADLRGLLLLGRARADAVVVRRLPRDSELLRAFCRALGETSHVRLEYRGEATAQLAHRALQALLASPRAAVPASQRAALRAAQGGLCAACGEALRPDREGQGQAEGEGEEEEEPWEVDHRVPLQQGGAHEPANLQALCRPCHREKTAGERLGLGRQNRLESQLSLELLGLFLAPGSKPRQLVHEVTPRASADESVLCFDAIGCRRNALLRCPRPLPVFAPLDELEAPAPGDAEALFDRFDFLWLDAGEAPEACAALPYTGPRLYWIEAAQHLLREGLVRPEQVRFGLRASGHVPPGALAGTLPAIEAAWREALQEQNPQWDPCSPQEAEYRAGPWVKLTYNSAIGLWNATSARKWRRVRSTDERDVPGGAAERKELVPQADGDFHWEFCVSTELVTNRTLRPLGQIALDMEQLAVARGLRLLRACPRVRAVRGVLVDGIYFTAAGDFSPEEEESLEGALRFADGAPMFRKGWESRPRVPACPQQPPAPPPSLERLLPPSWRQHLVEDPTDEAWRDRALDAILANGGAYVRGRAGTGKTTLVRALLARLREEAAERVHAVAFQHSSCRLLPDGDTLLHFLHALGRKQAGWLVVDEVSQVPTNCLGELAALRLVGWRLVLAGDWAGQLLPVSDRWGEVLAAREMDESRLVRELANDLRLDLVKNCRFTGDPAHFAWLQSLYDRRASELPRLVAEAARLHPAPAGDFWPDRVLCGTHRARLALNALLNERLAEGRADRALLPARPGGDGALAAQSCYVWPGLLLLGCGGGRREILNSVLYRVAAVERDEGGRLRSLVVAEAEGGEDAPRVALPAERAALRLRPSHALTYHASQGLTLAGQRLLLLGGRGRHFTLRHLRVGVSRVTRGEDLVVPGRAEEAAWLRRGAAALARLEALA